MNKKQITVKLPDLSVFRFMDFDCFNLKTDRCRKQHINGFLSKRKLWRGCNSWRRRRGNPIH
jgi:hypothetical protein